MYPTVMWPVKKGRASLLVPATSVVTTTEKTFVIRVRPNGGVGWVPVTKGAPAGGDLVEVYGPGRQHDREARRRRNPRRHARDGQSIVES